MIDGLTPYPAYKDAALRWSGQIPDHWSVERAKWLFQKMDREARPTDDVVTCFRDGAVTLRKNRRIRGFTQSVKEIGYQGVRRGDLVIHAMDGFAGAIGVSDSDGKCTPVYSVCQPKRGANSYYYSHIVREMAGTKYILALAKGIRERSTDFRFSGFASEFVPVPPATEQTAIVRFLDHADRRIRRYISAKQKLIELTEEQKQAIIHRAVTRGLDPNVRLKPSGVEWLGDVPEHWEVKKLRLGFRYAKGSRAAELTNDYIGRNPGPHPVFSGQTEDEGLMGNISWHEFDFDNEVILVTTVGARAMTTRVLSGKFSVSQNCAILIPRDGSTNVPFYEMVLQRLFSYERASISLIMQPSLRFADLNRFYVPHPPAEEQISIAETVGAMLNERQIVSESAAKQIALVREYRTRLIADVVTGKVDVREAAARLPDETGERDFIDEVEVLPNTDGIVEDVEFDAEPAEVEA